MIFLSTLIKVVSVTTILVVACGSTYYYINNNEVKPTQHLKGRGHHQHGLREEQSGHFCDHGHFIKTIEIEESVRPDEIPVEATLAHEKKLIKNHKQGNWDTIRIKTDYSSFRASQQYADFIENKLVKAMTAFLKAAVKVYPSYHWSMWRHMGSQGRSLQIRCCNTETKQLLPQNSI